MNYNREAGDVLVCLHVLDGFKSNQDPAADDHIVCQLDTDNGKINVASCRSCLEGILQAKPGAWGQYKTAAKQQAAALGVHIGG